MDDKKLLYGAGLVFCIIGAVYAFYLLVECDSACQSKRSQQKQYAWEQEERTRLARLPPPPPMPPPPPKAYSPNTSQFCNGQVVEEVVRARRRDFNPNKCAWVMEVLEKRVRIGRSYFVAEAWSDVGPEGLGNQVPEHFDFYEPSPGESSAKWRYMLCDRQTPSMKQWRCS